MFFTFIYFIIHFSINLFIKMSKFINFKYKIKYNYNLKIRVVFIIDRKLIQIDLLVNIKTVSNNQ